MDNLIDRAVKAGVQIRLNSEVQPGVLKETSPDVLILANGVNPFIPPLPGVNSPQVVSAVEVLSGEKAVKGAVIIIGGGLVGCETGEFLLEKVPGVTSVTILEMLDRMAANISSSYRPFFLARLKKMGIRMETQTMVEKITGKGVQVIRKGMAEFIAGDSVILAVGLKSNPEILESFRGLAPEVYSIGDGLKPRMIKEAIEEGFAVGIKI
jgi:pyruvate/2-oxoglutarate dehydrogenase complex dihydrolipoamide dehydrogenase (E3) component